MNPREPWFRASKGAWYVEINGKQVRLAKGKKSKAQAETAFYKLMAGTILPLNPNDVPGLLTVTLCGLFQQYSRIVVEACAVGFSLMAANAEAPRVDFGAGLAGAVSFRFH